MANFEFVDLPKTQSVPNVMIGAASPLWAYFGAATAGGVAFWWMTRWTRPVNLEAMLGAKALPEAGLEALVAAPVEAAEAVVEATIADVEQAAFKALAPQPENEAVEPAEASPGETEAFAETADPAVRPRGRRATPEA